MTAQFPVINGRVHDFGQIEFVVDDGLLLIETRTINYNDNMNREKVHGANAQEIGTTRGQYLAGGNIALTKRGAQKLYDKLGPGFYDRIFDVRVKYRDSDGGGTIVDQLRGVSLNGSDNAHSQGPAALESTHELNVTLILWNGVTPIDNMVV